MRQRGVVAAGLPGWLWLPDSPPRALVLAGHGLGLNKRNVFGIEALLEAVEAHAFALVAFDAPGHGERRVPGRAPADVYTERWRDGDGVPLGRELAAAVDALDRDLAALPLGYFGLSLATQYGVAFLAQAPRVRAAVLGLFRAGPRVRGFAAHVRCPVYFVRQEGDEVHPAEEVLALFAALASEDKTLVSSPGRHVQVPRAVLDGAVAFLARHLA